MPTFHGSGNVPAVVLTTCGLQGTLRDLLELGKWQAMSVASRQDFGTGRKGLFTLIMRKVLSTVNLVSGKLFHMTILESPVEIRSHCRQTGSGTQKPNP